MNFTEGSFLVPLVLSYPLAPGMRMRLGCRERVVLRGLDLNRVRFLVTCFFRRVSSMFTRTSGGAFPPDQIR